MKKPEIDPKDYLSASDIGLMGFVEREKRRLAEISTDQMDESHQWLMRMLNADKETFGELLEEDRQRDRDSIPLKKVGELLGLSLKPVRDLPLRLRFPRKNTSRGRRGVSCYLLPELIEYLTSLNPTFSDYDPTEGSLLKPEQVVELCGESGRNVTARMLARLRRDGCGPDYVQINVRVCRYRIKDVLDWLTLRDKSEDAIAPSEYLMMDRT